MNIEVQCVSILCLDFKKFYDFFRMNVLYNTPTEFVISLKSFMSRKLCLRGTFGNIRKGKLLIRFLFKMFWSSPFPKFTLSTLFFCVLFGWTSWPCRETRTFRIFCVLFGWTSWPCRETRTFRIFWAHLYFEHTCILSTPVFWAHLYFVQLWETLALLELKKIVIKRRNVRQSRWSCAVVHRSSKNLGQNSKF